MLAWNNCHGLFDCLVLRSRQHHFYQFLIQLLFPQVRHKRTVREYKEKFNQQLSSVIPLQLPNSPDKLRRNNRGGFSGDVVTINKDRMTTSQEGLKNGIER